jgi:arylsulfatase A-like enzyme
VTSGLSRFIVLLCDGARADVLGRLVARGDLPHVARRFVDGGALRRATTVFPSTTGPAHLPFITGCFPGTCDMPGIRWLDRREYARTVLSLSRFRSYIGAGTYLMRRDVRPGTPSLFTLLPDHASVYGACTPGIRPGRDKTAAFRLFQQVRSFVQKNQHENDEHIERYTLAAVAERPTFLFSAFYGVDSASHMTGPESPLVERCYRRFDDAVGRVFAALERAGTADETLVALVADHGLSATSHHIALDALVARHLGRTLSYPFILPGLVAAAAASMVSGNGMAHVYVPGPRGWGEPCLEAELPAGARDLIDELLGNPGIDLLVTRAGPGLLRVRSARGEALLSRGPTGGVEYEPRGGDPFGFAPMPQRQTVAEALASTFDSEYPDALVQLLQLFDSGRTGDLIVSARPGWDLRPAHLERPEHRGTHGALCREHMMVPFGLSRPFPAGPRRTVDLVPAALRRLGHAPPPCDGEEFPIS